MRFDHQPITFPTDKFNGFTPPTPQNMVFGKDSTGRTVVFPNQFCDTREAYEADLNELRTRINNHDWYYRLHNDFHVYSRGFHNEQAINALVQRRGGVFQTIWDTERKRHLGEC